MYVHIIYVILDDIHFSACIQCNIEKEKKTKCATQHGVGSTIDFKIQ